MAPKFGYLLPTRERIMLGQPAALPLVDLAVRAEDFGFDSIWIGDSLLAKPRHDPLTMMAGIATRTKRVELGTAVLLPALRNPVVLAHQIATIDQLSEGRIILGVGIAADVPNVRAEFAAAGVPFDKRVGRLMEGLRLAKALWRGDAVNWQGRWPVSDGILGPTPYRPGGPPIWYGGGVKASRERAARYFDGWFPAGPDVEKFSSEWEEVQSAAVAAGRQTNEVTAATYLTIAIDDDVARGAAAIDAYLENYYKVSASSLRTWQACRAGTQHDIGAWIKAYVDAGAEHIILRFVGDHEKHMGWVKEIREQLGPVRTSVS